MPAGVAGATNAEYVPNHIVSSRTTLHKIYHDAKRASAAADYPAGLTRLSPSTGGMKVEFKSIRRVVVGHDAQGKALAIFDGTIAPTQRSAGGNGVANLWITNEFPIEANAATDRAQTRVGVPPAANGTIFRIVDFPPASTAGPPAGVDHDKILVGMGIDPATQGYTRHHNTHRTKSLDYAIVLDGEIDMLMDDSEVHLKAGDVLIQQGTSHAWVNNSGKVCRIAFILIDAKTPAAWRQDWKP